MPTPVVTVTEPYPASQSLTLNGGPFNSGATLDLEASYELLAAAADLAGNVVQRGEQLLHVQIARSLERVSCGSTH